MDKNILIQNGVDVEKSLELFGDMEMYNESLGDFLAEVDNKLFKISHFKETVDMPNYAILVHSLKSDARYFGFVKLAEFAYAHELQSKANNTAFVNENYNALIAEANRVIAFVKQYLVSGAEPTNRDVRPAQPNVQTCIGSILVADDSDIIKNFVKNIFTGHFNVLCASDGAEAIKLIEQHSTNIKAMLLDLNMPNVDGFKVLEYMKGKNLFSMIPVSVITGNDNKDIDLNAFKYPIVDILKKPFSEQAVKNIVDKTIDFNSRH